MIPRSTIKTTPSSKQENIPIVRPRLDATGKPTSRTGPPTVFVPWVDLPFAQRKKRKSKTKKTDRENTLFKIPDTDPLSVTYRLMGLKKSDAFAYWNVKEDKSQLGVGYVKYKRTPPKNPFRKGPQVVTGKTFGTGRKELKKLESMGRPQSKRAPKKRNSKRSIKKK